MRLIRIGALVGSVVLLVATLVSMVSERSQARSEQYARVTATVLVADQSVEGTVARAVAVVGAANELTDPAVLIHSFGPDASACVSTDDASRCTGADLSALAAFSSAINASARGGGPAAVVDEDSDSLLVVLRGSVTAALRLPAAVLLDERARTTVEAYDAVVDLTLLEVVRGDGGRVGPLMADSRIVVTDTMQLPDGGGAIRVVASADDGAGLVGDGIAGYGLTGYLILLALGTALMALAGWTFFLDRRALERRATTDELTGLVNRREFERVTEEALLVADRFQTGVCLMLIDLNGFKQINDTLGHQFGDVVLKAAAQRLRSAVRDTDVVGRWGGDEFVILLPGVEDGSGVRASAERVGRLLAATPIAGDVTVHAAIGAALFPRHGQGLDELISAADVAMYSAKTTGVVYRLADAHSVQLSADEVSATTGYDGPDRRRPSPEAEKLHRS
jgi:diguanylate cyclase (GGDEF)-like protein